MWAAIHLLHSGWKKLFLWLWMNKTFFNTRQDRFRQKLTQSNIFSEKGLKWTKKVEKGWKKLVRPAFGFAQHSKAGRNTQQPREGGFECSAKKMYAKCPFFLLYNLPHTFSFLRIVSFLECQYPFLNHKREMKKREKESNVFYVLPFLKGYDENVAFCAHLSRSCTIM